MLKLTFCFFIILAALHSLAGDTADVIINKSEVQRIETILSSDQMQGRRPGTAGIEKAADFIAHEFAKGGLQTLTNRHGYKQAFKMIGSRSADVKGSWGSEALHAANTVVFTSSPQLTVNQTSNWQKAYVRKGDNLSAMVTKYLQTDQNLLVLVDSSFRANFPRLNRLKQQFFHNEKNVVFILTTIEPTEFTITSSQNITTSDMSNVVAMIPGKSKSNEYVIFSAHYDHLGIGNPQAGDSIFNGANDDAAGTTAVIMLAKYFKALGNNERTLVFAAFTAEESGGFGSQYFSRQFDPEKVIAMFNIEMIGTESKWGKNSAYITGYDQTNMGKILEANLEGSGFKFYPDPYPTQQLFYRSDNATLARLGVPAHTISTSKMDSEKFYHTVDDEIETLDMDNMTMIIKAIAVSSKSIVSGKDAPSRVNTAALR